MPAKGKHHHLPHHHHHHHHHQSQQHQQHLLNVHQSSGVGAPQPYNTVVSTTRGYVSHAGSDFHVPGQSYGAQAGGQVGGGGNNIGVTGTRGPPSLSNIQSIGQSTASIQSSTVSSGSQHQSQASTAGVQQQQQSSSSSSSSSGPVPTTTPPIHSPSSQDMGKPIHHQTQPPSLQQPYISNQARAISQGFYQMGPRPVQSRTSAHRSNQAGGATHVVGMSSVGSSTGQPPMYSHHTNINVSGTPTMFVQGQVPNIHTGPHQSPIYPVNSQMPQITAFTPQHRHQTHQSPQFFTSYPTHAILQPSMFQFTPNPATQLAAFCYSTHHPSTTGMNLTRTNANAVSGGAAHVGGPLNNAQTNAAISQGTLQQPTQQSQTIPPMAISLSQSGYAGHNGGVTNSLNSTYQKVTTRPNALMNIVDPATGKNVAEDIYRTAAIPNEESATREIPQSQDSAIIAEFASRVAKAASESSETNSDPTASSIHDHQHHPLESKNLSMPIISNLHMSQLNTRGNAPIESQCNLIPPITMENPTKPIQSPADSTYSVAPVASETCLPMLSEMRSSLMSMKDVQSQSEAKSLDNTAVSPLFSICDNANENNDSTIYQSNTITHSTTTTDDIKTESQSESMPLSVDSSETIAGIEVPISMTVSNEHSCREFILPSISSSNSPLQRKLYDSPQHKPQIQSHSQFVSQQNLQSQISSEDVVLITNDCDLRTLSSQGDPDERKTNGKNVNLTSPFSYVHQVHQKPNGGPSGDTSEIEIAIQADASQKSTDGKTMQKQKGKNKLKGRDLNRKGAEKEGTDMDAFVNAPLQSTKIVENSQDLDQKSHVETTPVIMNIEQPQQPVKESKKQSEIPGQKVEIEESITSQSEISKEEIETNSQQLEKLKAFSHQDIKDTQLLSNKCVINEIIENNEILKTNESTISIDNVEETSGNSNLVVGDSNIGVQLLGKETSDVVDHVKINDTIDIKAIVAHKNEENIKVSGVHQEFSDTSLSLDEVTPVIDKPNETQTNNQNDPIQKLSVAPALKYQYNSYQWSPRNTSGKKEYDREFLMKLQDDPQSRTRPSNLPDLEVVLKDCSRQINRNTVDMRMFKDTRAHEQLFPLFAKSSFNSKLPPPTKKSYQGKSKTSKPNAIHVSLSLREDVKLRETENAWKPTRMKDEVVDEDIIKTEALYKKVRSVLNKLTPQKFNTLVNQVRSLEIDTHGRLQGVIDLVFEKAVDEPSYSVAYALMCKELAYMKVTSSNKKAPMKSDVNDDFRKLIVTRCQREFEKNEKDEMARKKKINEIEDCTDLDRKKELQLDLEEKDRQLRLRSVGNIRFIGELYKQDMLTSKIMHECIEHLLQDIDEENLECLCKLLTTIGKLFESKSDLNNCFTKLSDLTNRKSNKKISSRVRFMIQDVIDLRKNNWVPRRDESNPKTMDQIQKEAESERIEIQLNNTPINTPRKDDRNNDRRRNRGVGSNINDGWSTPVGKTRQPYSVEMSKLNTKPPPMDDLKLGSRNTYVWNTPTAGKANTITPNKFAVLETISMEQDKRSALPLPGSRSTGPREYRLEYKSSWEGRGSRNGSHQMGTSSSNRDSSFMENSRSASISMPPPPPMKYKPTTSTSTAPNTTSNIQTAKPIKSDAQLLAIFKSIFEKAENESSTEAFINTTLETIEDNFDSSSLPRFIQEALNTALERTTKIRHRFSILLSHMINNNMITFSLVQNECTKILEVAEELLIDIPKCWIYFAEILSEMVVLGAHPLVELEKTLAILKRNGKSGELLGELLTKLAKDQGPKWVADKWNESGLEWNNIIDLEQENIDDIIKDYNLEFIKNGFNNTEKSSSNCNLSLEEIHDHLMKLMRDSNFDNITSWITANVGDGAKQPKFVRVLITAILKVSIEAHSQSWRLNSETFKSLLPLITRYVDTEPQLELQCLYAIQAHIYELMHPQGVLSNVIDALCEGGIISDDAFLAWQKSTDQTEMLGHAIAVKALTSFFVNLQETRDESSEEA